MVLRLLWRSSLQVAALCATLFVLLAPPVAARTTISVYLREWPPELNWEYEMIALFEKENPDIKVEVIKDAGQYHDKLNLLWSTGNPPDVWNHGGRVREYDERGWLLDLGPFVRRDARELDTNDFFPGAWSAYQIDGKFIGMPFVTMGTFMFINDTLFAESGLETPTPNWDDPTFTWETMVDYAKKLTRRTADNRVEQFGVDLGGALAWQGLGIQYLWGADRYDKVSYATGFPNLPTMKTPESVRAFREYMRLVREEQVSPGIGGLPWARSFSGWSFLAQRTAMAWAAGHSMNDMAGANLGFTWSLAPLPFTPYGRTGIVYTDPWMVAKTTKQPEAAWRFVKFITGKQATADYARKLGFAPARKSSARVFVEQIAAKAGMRPADLVTALDGSQKYGRESIDHILYGELEIEAKIAGTLSDMYQGKIPVEVAMENADRILTQFFAELRQQSKK